MFLKPREALFFVLEIHKRSLFWPILRKKKKVGKMAIFGREPWVNPVKKMSIFQFFELLVLIA